MRVDFMKKYILMIMVLFCIACITGCTLNYEEPPEKHPSESYSDVEEETEKEFSQEEAPAELSISPFMRMLEGLKSDDLLLRALILLFADCKSEMGNEAIILLSLLLLC